jgi:sirohydrochlorin ferrochelatase
MRMNRRSISTFLVALFGCAAVCSAEQRGILLLAHGGNAEWNAHVSRLAGQVDRVHPTEVAFGMATRANIQAAIDRLQERRVDSIVAVPLFVSSWSSVITSTEYLLGQRAEAPPQLAIFARMSHGSGGHAPAAPNGDAPAAHSGHAPAAHGDHAPAAHGDHAPAAQQGSTDATAPVKSSVPIRMSPALNDHPLVVEILIDRAQSISTEPQKEAVVVVAHGPVGDDENRRWLADMRSLAERITDRKPFAAVDYLTLRDDAPKPVRDQATTELRAIVSKRIESGQRVLIVPLLVAYGGIERGLRERLEGLPYAMPSSGLVPDERLVTWILEMAASKAAANAP